MPYSITLEFVLYTIDSWKEGDSVAVLIGESEIDLGDLTSGSSDDGEKSDTQAGIEWTRNVISQGSNLGFGEANDEKYLVQMTVPEEQFFEDKLFFGISVVLNEDSENSAGIDDLMMEAHYHCQERRALLLGSALQKSKNGGINNRTSTAATTPIGPNINQDLVDLTTADATGDDSSDDTNDGRYCLSEDFPCGAADDDTDVVYVCHYSKLRGFQTLCIPEKESHILRYYPQDYCGPCVGTMSGLAGLAMNWS